MVLLRDKNIESCPLSPRLLELRNRGALLSVSLNIYTFPLLVLMESGIMY